MKLTLVQKQLQPANYPVFFTHLLSGETSKVIYLSTCHSTRTKYSHVSFAFYCDEVSNIVTYQLIRSWFLHGESKNNTSVTLLL